MINKNSLEQCLAWKGGQRTDATTKEKAWRQVKGTGEISSVRKDGGMEGRREEGRMSMNGK